MSFKDKVVEGLSYCGYAQDCDGCPYSIDQGGCYAEYLERDALRLINAYNFAWESVKDEIKEMQLVSEDKDVIKRYQFLLNYMDVQNEHIENGVYI